MPATTLDQIVSLCKRRGFIFPGSAIYGGLANSWDYGPLGVELKNNVKKAWWEANVYHRDDMEGLDAAILMNRKVWQYSGHEATFNDPLVDNKKTGGRYRLDHLLQAQPVPCLELLIGDLLAYVRKDAGDATFKQALADEKYKDVPIDELVSGSSAAGKDVFREMSPREIATKIAAGDENFITGLVGELSSNSNLVPIVVRLLSHLIDPDTGEVGDWTAPRLFNLMFSTHAGPLASDENKVYLRPETAQGIFVNFKHVQETMRRKLPFGVAQIGKSFRNEITPGNFTFRTREFEQMEIEYFVKPGEDEACHEEWVAARFQWYQDLGLAEERLRLRPQAAAELAHYAKACVDIEYLFPGSLGYSELEGIANRTDFDLSAHSREVDMEDLERLQLEKNEDAVDTLNYFDQEEKRRYIPYVVEPSAGADRAMLAFLCEAFEIEPTGEIDKKELEGVKDALSAFLKSVEKNKELSAHQKGEMEVYGMDAIAHGAKAFDKIYAMLACEGASKIVLGKKLKGLVDRCIEANFRTVLKLHPRLAPIKVAVFPIKRNHDEIVAKAKGIKHLLQPFMRSVYDDTGAIGKLYRRQDEIGTPFCITVDFESLEDGTVTVRERDTMHQERVKIVDLPTYFLPKLQG